MVSRENRELVGRLIYSVLAQNINVREAIKLFPKTKDKNIECAYHALVHFEADEEIRYKDIEYREAQDDYLEFLAQTLSEGKDLPQNIIDEYKPYYKGTASLWQNGFKGFIEEFKRFINI
ncbi:MAG: hypothetical protein E7Z89_08335 [Cyanobacteria bacterium SIG28]|nr:hypothetical protein [Cyanobacteria bacterium SIG28]